MGLWRQLVVFWWHGLRIILWPLVLTGKCSKWELSKLFGWFED
jgi:hypothetical protein